MIGWRLDGTAVSNVDYRECSNSRCSNSIVGLAGLFRTELFEGRQKYGLAVQMCRHPALSTWIRHDALEAMRPLLEKVRMGINHHTKPTPARVNSIPFHRISIVS
jgi:hypothetical protein